MEPGSLGRSWALSLHSSFLSGTSTPTLQPCQPPELWSLVAQVGALPGSAWPLSPGVWKVPLAGIQGEAGITSFILWDHSPVCLLCLLSPWGSRQSLSVHCGQDVSLAYFFFFGDLCFPYCVLNVSKFCISGSVHSLLLPPGFSGVAVGLLVRLHTRLWTLLPPEGARPLAWGPSQQRAWPRPGVVRASLIPDGPSTACPQGAGRLPLSRACVSAPGEGVLRSVLVG